MMAAITYSFLQEYWWVIISLLASLLVLLMFVQGGQTLIYTLGKDETQRNMIVNTLGRKWEFTFTTLVTFGGAFFASFPLFYSTSFGGAYWVWMAILFCFIIQAIAYEFRSKPNNLFGKRTYEVFLFINGALGTFLIGTAVSTFFTGSRFSVSDLNFSQWESPWHGLEALLNVQNLALGLTIFFLARVLGILYIMNSVEEESIFERSIKHLWYNAIPFLVVFLFFAVRLMFLEGFAVNPSSGQVSMEPYKYFHNLVQMPLIAILLLAGVVLVLSGLYLALLWRSRKGIWFTGGGTVLTVFSLFLLAGFNNTSFYPSVYDLQDSLTIHNASSSYYTLKAMSIVSFLVPFVLAYIWYAWRSINRSRITGEELKHETHAY
jgi:cytochrome d ubiquinol oxidase subunit II